MSDEELVNYISNRMEEDKQKALKYLSEDHSTDDPAEIRRRITALFNAKPYTVLKHPDCEDDKMYCLPMDSHVAQQAKRYSKYLSMATFLNGGGTLTDEQMAEYRELEAEFDAEEEAELTLEGAVEVLNQKEHRSYNTWRVTEDAIGPFVAECPATEWPDHGYNEFEAIAIAEKYLREEK